MDFIVFSDDYGRHISSCHHIFNIISKNSKVLWVNTVGMRAPSVSKGYDIKRSVEKILSWLKPVKKFNTNLFVYYPFMLPFQNIAIINAINKFFVINGIKIIKKLYGFGDTITWATVPNVPDIIGNTGEKLIVYNCTDDYALWPGGNKELIRNQEIATLKKADLALASSEQLVKNCSPYNKKTLLYPHAVDLKHFINADKGNTPEAMKGIPKPIVGFFGYLYEKINYSLIEKIAKSYPQCSVVLVGKQGLDLTFLRDTKNIYLTGHVDYKQLPSYAANFDVGILPYVLDEETTKKAPLKLKEYLSLGFPVVSVRIQDVEPYKDYIHIADNDDEFVKAVGLSFNENDSGARAKRQQAVYDETWENRVCVFESILKNEFKINI